MNVVDILPERWVNWILDGLGGIPAARRTLGEEVISKYACAAAARPQPFSLAVDGYTTWTTLTDRSYTSRHLPPCSDEYHAGLPDADAVVDLFMQKDGKQVLARDTSLLFPFFAQWFTDSFLRTHPTDYRKNQSNHGIDLCQIYGLNEDQTVLLRDKRQGQPKGRLKSQRIDGEEYGVFMFEKNAGGAAIVRDEFKHLYSEVNFTRVFGKLSDEQRLRCFAVGLEHGNSTLGNVLMNTLFLREHNRLAGLLEQRYPRWDDDRVFETARMINIVLVLKIVVQDYIRHIAGFDLPLEVVPGFGEKESWYRTNWMAVEFNLLYRWHSLIPKQFRLGSTTYDGQRMVNANDLLLEVGADQVIRDASAQKAGRIGLGHTPAFLRHVKGLTVDLARKAKLMAYNDYRAHFHLERFKHFEQLTSDPTVIAELRKLYGSIDKVEYLVGLFAEEYAEKEMMGELQLTMVAHDAFTHALTNPLLAKRIFNEATFSPEGMREIVATNRLADLVVRNTKIKEPKTVSFKCNG
jgi:prostaglandin-endoperoxide synthase 2